MVVDEEMLFQDALELVVGVVHSFDFEGCMRIRRLVRTPAFARRRSCSFTTFGIGAVPDWEEPLVLYRLNTQS